MNNLDRPSGFAISAILAAAICAVPFTAQAETALRIVVHDSVKTPGPHMAGALVVATALLRSVSVHTEWHQQREDSDPSASVDTQRPTIVVASSSSFERDAFTPNDILGRVVQPSVRAYVLYDRIVDLARRYQVDPAAILGQVIAHEVGHLVFGEQHSLTGFMADRIGPGTVFDDSPGSAAERPGLRMGE